ncbi:type VII secretion system-associated protein [Streptomyces sp. ADMS]|uniref:type VII secretion system-associated protein n=1 Tax=Streptomyces sp. ADMS TaxID=3071415 RepID=UPI00296ED754|nr:type VII secretion system-associated protein [Streptomyces sp. ADMS]MDW4908110.1 type VII secretion system-associated protein [Streptomyces sp. ADMS]
MNDNTAAGTSTAEAADAAPPVPEEIKEAARLAPDHWLGMVDPAWSGEGEPPNWAVVGQWRSGLDGEIEEWRANEEYRPSPQALGWPAPTDVVDEAVQLAATGYGPGEAVSRLLAGAEVAVLLGPGGGPLSATSPDGASVVPVFTSPTYLHAAGRFGYQLMPVIQVADRIPEGHVLYLNPSGPVSMTVETDALRQAVEETARAENGAWEGEEPEPPAPVRPSTVGGAHAPATPAATAPAEDKAVDGKAAGGSALGLDSTT